VGFLQRLWGREEPSKKIAKERLCSVLVCDRANVSAHLFDALKNDLVKAISKYMDVDDRRLELKLQSSPEATALVANVPVLRMKRHSG
jgi:cell division topological specificity factor